MPLKFTKMHGLGNDFIVVNALHMPFSLTADEIRALAHRRFGIGFDQALIVEPATVSSAQFNYRIFNADGGEVENCGNGARCFAQFVLEQGLTKNRNITVQSAAGLMNLFVEDDGQVTVEMAIPQFAPESVPFIAEREAASYTIETGIDTGVDEEVGIKQVEAGVVAVGNPHVVLVVDDVNRCHFEQLGPQLESHSRFPNRVNVGFMQRLNRGEIQLRVYERGVGETMACGTGACAAVATGIRRGLLDRKVTVHLTGGDLQVRWPENNKPLAMTGPCETVYEGTVG